MVSFRTEEDQRKEFDLQAIQTVRINERLNERLDAGDTEYKEKLEDLAVFANSLRPEAPAETYVVLGSRPDIQFIAEGEDYKATIYITGNTWRFSVNGMTHADSIDTMKAYKPGKQLLLMWETLIPKLPENFIIHGLVEEFGTQPPEVEAAIKHIHSYLGLGRTENSRQVIGIVKDKKVHPLTYDEFRSITGTTPDHLNQRLNTRSIKWGEG
jgi:hypothetical protein